MMEKSPTTLASAVGPPSNWIMRWTHLLPASTTVLDIACGRGRHMKWFAQEGHMVTGVDRSAEAITTAKKFGPAICADIESNPWPLRQHNRPQQFGAVIVTNYLWRPLFPTIIQSLAPGGILIYETFSHGNETVGKPSNPDFLLRPAELLSVFRDLQLIAFEEGFLQNPPRFVQRIAAVRPDAKPAGTQPLRRQALDAQHSR